VKFWKDDHATLLRNIECGCKVISIQKKKEEEEAKCKESISLSFCIRRHPVIKCFRCVYLTELITNKFLMKKQSTTCNKLVNVMY
jgi:hypothetical protein